MEMWIRTRQNWVKQGRKRGNIEIGLMETVRTNEKKNENTIEIFLNTMQNKDLYETQEAGTQ